MKKVGFLAFYFLFTASIFAGSLELPKGLTYKILTVDGRKVHHLEIDPLLFNIIPSQSEKYKLEHVYSMALRHKAVAAINGGYFTVWGDFADLPIGILKINGNWHATPTKPTAAIGWSDPSQKVLFDEVSTNISGTIEGNTFPIHGINQPRNKREIILYNSFFRQTTATSKKGLEYVVQWDTISDISFRSTRIPKEGSVLSVGPALIDLFLRFQVGSNFFWQVEVKGHLAQQSVLDEEWDEVLHIMGAGPLIVNEGIPLNDVSNLSPSYELCMAHLYKPRTGVGLLPNGHWIFVVVDGDRFAFLNKHGGMTLLEFAALMKDFNSVNTINFDGGGSSVLVINDNVVNTPCGELKDVKTGLHMRRVSDALLVIPKG